MHGLALNITIQTYAGHVDFGIIADKKALPYANDFAKAIESAFREALALLAMADPAAPSAPIAALTPVKTRKTLVPQVTKAALLEKAPSVKRARHPDTVSSTNNSTRSNAPSHGKSVVKSVVKKSPEKTIKRKLASA